MHLQFSGVGNEIQTIFCRLFDTPIVKVTAMIPGQDNIFEEYNKALLERKKAMLADSKEKVQIYQLQVNSLIADRETSDYT